LIKIDSLITNIYTGAIYFFIKNPFFKLTVKKRKITIIIKISIMISLRSCDTED